MRSSQARETAWRFSRLHMHGVALVVVVLWNGFILDELNLGSLVLLFGGTQRNLLGQQDCYKHIVLLPIAVIKQLKSVYMN